MQFVRHASGTKIGWLACLMGFAVAAASAWLPKPANATCLNPRNLYFSIDPQAEAPAEIIHVYINAPDEGDAGAWCPRDVRRSGLSVTDVENLTRTTIAAMNDAAATTPRLVYGGRVCHDTFFRCRTDDGDNSSIEEYIAAWNVHEPNLPLGVVIEGAGCGYSGGYAGIKYCDRGDWGATAAETVSLKSLFESEGVLCPRSSTLTEVNDNCHIDADPDPTGAPCTPQDMPPQCTCLDYDEPGEDYPGQYLCEDSVWSACKCSNRNYEVFGIGDGLANPAEPQRCDSLGPRDTKELGGVFMHELGHTLGLGHPEQEGDQCLGIGSPVLPGDDQYQGVMASTYWPRLTTKGRQYHFDDLRGLDWLFTRGPNGDDQPYAGGPSLNTAWDIEYFESSDQGATWDGPFEVPWPQAPGTTMPVSVTSAVDDSGFLALAYGTDSDDFQVGVLTRDADGFDDVGDSLVIPNASTRWPAAIAYGGGRLAVAWLDQEATNRRSSLVWAIRDIQPGSQWNTTGQLADYDLGVDVNILKKDIGMSYDAASDRFVVAVINDATWVVNQDRKAVDTVPWIYLLDPDDGLMVYNEDLPQVGVVHGIGKPACHGTLDTEFTSPTHCALPVALPVYGGPDLGIVYFGVNSAQGLDIVPSQSPVQNLGPLTYGRLDIATGALGQGQEQFLGTMTTTNGGIGLLFGFYSMQALRPLGLDLVAAPIGVTEVDEGDIVFAPGGLGDPVVPSWSLSIGSRIEAGQVIYSIWRAVPDQPDGGLDEGGTDGTEDVTDTGSGETMGGGADSGNGCQCQTSYGRSGLIDLLAFALFGLGLSRVRRR